MIRQVLADVRQVIDNWPQMQATLDEAIDYCASHVQPVAADELKETLAFLRWLKKDNFLFIGLSFIMN